METKSSSSLKANQILSMITSVSSYLSNRLIVIYSGRVHREILEVNERELQNAGDPNRKVSLGVVEALKNARGRS
jgi:nicotinamide mononucleotide (NMN) deamidase PncC